MKNVLILLLSVFIVFSACDGQKDAEQQTSLDEVKEKGSELLQATKNYTVEQRQVYEEKLKEKIQTMKAQVDELRVQLDSVSEEQRQKMQEQVQKMDKQIYDLEQGLGQLKQASDDAWAGIKDGIEQTVKKIEGSAN